MLLSVRWAPGQNLRGDGRVCLHWQGWHRLPGRSAACGYERGHGYGV